MNNKEKEFNKRWINVSFFVTANYDKRLTKKREKEEVKIVYETIKSLFMSAQLENLFNKGYSPRILGTESLENKGFLFNPKKDALLNPEITHQNFEIVLEYGSDGSYIFNVHLEPYSLDEFMFDGYAIYKTNEDIMKIRGLKKEDMRYGRLIREMEFDKKGNPIETSLEGFVLINYLMEDRINQAKKDSRFEKIVGDKISKIIKRFKKMEKNESGKEWVKKVERLLENKK